MMMIPIAPSPSMESSTPSSGGIRLEQPQPETALPMSDPNDLLLVDAHITDNGTTVQITTESGFYLSPVADLGQHVAGTKAVSASFSHDGILIASGGHDKRVLVFSVQAKQQLFALEGHHSQQITQVRFSLSGPRRFLATASFDKTVHIWDLGAEGEASPETPPDAPVLILKDVHEEPIWSIDFVPGESGPRLCSIDASGKLVLWDLETGISLHTTIIKTSDDQSVTVRQLKAGPLTSNHPSILAIANGSHVELFNCDETSPKASLLVSGPVGDQKGKPVVALSWGDQHAPDTLVTATSEAVSIWDLSAVLRGGATSPPTPLAILPIPADKITCCTLWDGKVVIGGYQGIYLWEVGSEGRGRSAKFPAHEGLVVSVSRCGDTLLGSASHDGWVKLWQLERPERRLDEESTG